MAEELMAIMPDKIIQNLLGLGKELPPMARRILDRQGNLITVNTKGLVQVAENIEAMTRIVQAERGYKEATDEFVSSEKASQLVREQQRKIDGLERRLEAQTKRSLATTAGPAMAVDAKGSR